MKTKIKISILEKAAKKIDAIVDRVQTNSEQPEAELCSRASINLAVKEVIADLETAIVEIKNLYKQQELTEKEPKEIERLKPVSSQI